MHVRRTSAFRGIYWIAAALAALAMVAAAAPARAAGDEDYKGWYVGLDLALTQPNSLDQHYANYVEWPGTGTGIWDRAERLVLDNDADLTGTLKFGYGFGNGNGALQVSFWSFDNEDKIEDSLSGGVYPTLFGYGSYGGFYLYDVDFRASAKTKAATFDVDYLRSYAVGKKTTVTWLAGLRSATFEQTQDFAGTEDGSSYVYTQHKNFKSTALGLRLGAAVNFGFTEHFSLAGSTAFSFLQADTKGDSNQYISDYDQYETKHGEDDNIRGEIRDYDLKAVWTYGHLDYFVGYSMSNWDGMVVDPVPANEGGYLALGPMSARGRGSISFNSLHAGVTFKFGGD